MMVAADRPAMAGAAVSADRESAVASYVDQAAALLGIRLEGECRAGVVAAFMSYNDAATLLMEFPLAVDIEPASVYTLGGASEDR
jgi:hypothetical protein